MALWPALQALLIVAQLLHEQETPIHSCFIGQNAFEKGKFYYSTDNFFFLVSFSSHSKGQFLPRVKNWSCERCKCSLQETLEAECSSKPCAKILAPRFSSGFFGDPSLLHYNVILLFIKIILKTKLLLRSNLEAVSLGWEAMWCVSCHNVSTESVAFHLKNQSFSAFYFSQQM